MYRFSSRTGRPTEQVQTLDGHPFGVRDGTFFLAERAYGPAPAGSTVRVTAEGVFVDGERRGDLPPAAEAASTTDAAE